MPLLAFALNFDTTIVPADPKTILILTASFGEGHNTAAKGVAAALKAECGQSLEVEVLDVLSKAHPSVLKVLQRSYNFTTTKTPQIWYRFYRMTESMEMNRIRMQILRKVKRDLRRRLFGREIVAVICTYPIYNLLIQEIYRKELSVPFPIYTVITDSVNIHAVWLKGPSDVYFVTDTWTRQLLCHEDIPADRIFPLGFPIHPGFARHLNGVPRSDPAGGERRILCFGTSSRKNARATLEALAAWNDPRKHITFLMGKNEERLRSTVREASALFAPGKFEAHGWVDNVPELLQSHHLVISKAGGATVHEAMAAGTPMCISGCIPGQEEGNAALLQSAGCGISVERPEQLSRRLNLLFSDHEELWRRLQENTHRVGRPNAARDIAAFVLEAARVYAH